VRRDVKLLAGVLAIAAAGFAAASIVSGQSALSAETTGTTGTTATVPHTVTVTATQTQTQTVTTTVVKKAKPTTVLLCHRTGSGRFVTIRVKLKPAALALHIRRGDVLGRCTAAKIRQMRKAHGHKG
jgi:hypothetical protein